MKQWQIQTHYGFILGIFKAVTAYGALCKYAESKGFVDWVDLCTSIRCPKNYIVKDFRIIV